MSTKQQSTVTKYLSVHTLPPDVCNCVCVSACWCECVHKVIKQSKSI